MTASERINAILSHYGISAKTFSERLGMERPQAIYDIINGKTRSITEKMAIKIISVFSDINKSWLMSGEGAMLTEGPYERMNRILKTEGITQREFEKGTGGLSWFVPGIYSNAQKNPGDPNVLEEWVGAFLKRFPRYSKEWILYGTPPMMIDNKGEVTTFVREMDAGHSVQKVPIFEMEATAGFSALYRDFSSNVSDYITIPNLPPVDGAIFARGDSMSPLIASGDIVIFKKVDLIPENILWGHIYIVSYAVDGDDYTVLKYIRQSQREGYIRLESFNSRFDPQDIPASSITALALVKASITFHTIG